MKILIIGGTGLISTPLTHFLLARGDDVTLYNRGGTQSRVPEDIKVMHGDRQNYAAFENQMREAGHFDAVIDMVGFAPDDAISAVRAFAGRTGQFVFCSTVDVYRKPATRLPYTEAETYGGLNPYGKNKVSCERTFLQAHARGAFPVTIIRPAYTYGEGRGLLYPVGSAADYLGRIRAARPLIVPGDGNSLWVACHADDVARAFVGAVGNERAAGRAYHTTGDEWMTWNNYHEGVAEALAVKCPVLVHIPTDALVKIAPERAASVADNFQFNNIFDNNAAATELGFRQTIPWVDGVKRVIAWCDRQPPVPLPGELGIDDRIISAWLKMTETFTSQFKH